MFSKEPTKGIRFSVESDYSGLPVLVNKQTQTLFKVFSRFGTVWLPHGASTRPPKKTFLSICRNVSRGMSNPVQRTNRLFSVCCLAEHFNFIRQGPLFIFILFFFFFFPLSFYQIEPFQPNYVNGNQATNKGKLFSQSSSFTLCLGTEGNVGYE